MQALKDDNLEIRRQAIRALARSGDQSIAATLELYLNDKNPEICQEAAYALGEIGDDDLTNILLKALGNEDSGVRRHIVEALGKIGNDTAIDSLEAALQDINLEVRVEAALALGRFGNNKIENSFPDDEPNDEDDWSEWERLEERVTWDKDYDEENFEGEEDLEIEFNESYETAIDRLLDEPIYDEQYAETTYIPFKLWIALIESNKSIKEDFESFEDDESENMENYLATATDLEELVDPRALPFLSQRLVMEGATDVMMAILVIQANCRYYNHEVWQAAIQSEKSPQSSPTQLRNPIP